MTNFKKFWSLIGLVATIGGVLWLVVQEVTVNLLVGGSIPPAGDFFNQLLKKVS